MNQLSCFFQISGTPWSLSIQWHTYRYKTVHESVRSSFSKIWQYLQTNGIPHGHDSRYKTVHESEKLFFQIIFLWYFLCHIVCLCVSLSRNLAVLYRNNQNRHVMTLSMETVYKVPAILLDCISQYPAFKCKDKDWHYHKNALEILYNMVW
jgi:hypothetical protein